MMKGPIVPNRFAIPAWFAANAVVLGLGLAGCRVGPAYVAPAVTAPAAFKEAPVQGGDGVEWKVAQPQEAALRGRWWEIYQEPELNALEAQLEIDNQTIRVAFENYMQARALVRETRAQYFPAASVAPSYTRSRSSANLSSAAGSAPNQQFQVFALPGEVSWGPDLWGRVRNAVRASQYAAQVSAADLALERLTEQASLAEYFFEIRGQDALEKILDDTVDADQKAFDAEQARYDTGVDDQVALVQAETTLKAAQSAAINSRIARAQYEHAIAMLVGKLASSFSIPVRAMTWAPPPIPIGLPSQLLERRPDVAASERNMAAANAQIGIAYAAYYPSLTLTATGGFESSVLKNLLDWPSRFWSVGATLSESVYDGGLRRATVHQYIALYNANLAAYRQSVLAAFQQVEDYLAEVRLLSQQIRRQQEAVSSARTFLQLEQARYDSGIDPYIDVTIAQTTLLSNQLALVNLHVQDMTASVELIQALGGGWDRSQLPTADQVTQAPSGPETAILK
jgi:NodT family efflux transporter outer membrane factor (OMF) lipoprotein